MFLKRQCFLFLFVISPFAKCVKKQPCDITDVACVTAAHNPLLKRIIAGNSTFNIMSSDPLHKDKIQLTLPYMNLNLTDPHMYGTQSCEARRLKFKNDDWEYSLICAKLTLESDYEINGDINSVHIEGKGKCEIVYDKYYLGISGRQATLTGEDGNDYLHITFYKMDFTDVLGSVVFNFTNLFNGDITQSAKVHEYINNNWMRMHDIIGEPIIHSLIGYLFSNINKYLEIIPKNEIFYKHTN